MARFGLACVSISETSGFRKIFLATTTKDKRFYQADPNRVAKFEKMISLFDLPLCNSVSWATGIK